MNSFLGWKVFFKEEADLGSNPEAPLLIFGWAKYLNSSSPSVWLCRKEENDINFIGLLGFNEL